MQQHPLHFTTNRTDRTFFVWRLNSAQPSHPGHSTILLQSEIPSGMCEKLRTAAASNSRDHASQSLIIACSLHAYIFLFFTHILFMVNHTINATPPERLQLYTLHTHFFLHISNTDVTRTPKQFTNNYCIWSPSSTERWIMIEEKWRFVKSIRHLKRSKKKLDEEVHRTKNRYKWFHKDKAQVCSFEEHPCCNMRISRQTKWCSPPRPHGHCDFSLIPKPTVTKSWTTVSMTWHQLHLWNKWVVYIDKPWLFCETIP